MYKISRFCQSNVFKIGAAILLSLAGSQSFAATIKIQPNTVVSTPVTYDNVTLDMSEGSFIVKQNGILTVKNSTINGTLSKQIPILITVDNGKLNLENNKVNLTTFNLPPHPQTQSLEYFISITLGRLNINKNDFKIAPAFTAGFLITTSSIPTTGFKFRKNRFENFHGVLYLIASDKALVANNTFVRNSYGNIVIIGNNSKIYRNSIYFSGNNNLGNSIDIIDSSNIDIKENVFFTPTCHGIYVLNSRDIDIDENTITGSLSYAMNIYSFPETFDKIDDYVMKIVSALKLNHLQSENIRVTQNYMSQNRYGLAAVGADNLFVKENYFSQRFQDAAQRKFWTNNEILLKNVTNLTWLDNLYKEAFTQDIDGDNAIALKFVVFPKSGGVIL